MTALASLSRFLAGIILVIESIYLNNPPQTLLFLGVALLLFKVDKK